MGQMSFCDIERRYEGLDAKRDPLPLLARLVPWEEFRPQLRAALVSVGHIKPASARSSPAGRKPWDEVLMFKALILQSLYNLSDEQTEYQLRDRLSFMRFLGLGLEDPVPDATTLWLYREALAQAGMVEQIFDTFDQYLREQGYRATGGQIVDACIVEAPRQRNTKLENDAVRAGQVPKKWQTKKAKAKLRQKDLDARWTQKNGKNYYGYKNHVSIDRKHKLVRRYTVTNAARHDSGEFANVLDPTNSSADVWADSAYRSAQAEAMLQARGLRSRVHRRGARGHPLNAREQAGNTTRSRVRARVEHVFGHQATAMKSTLVRTIGLVRAKAKIGLMNLAYNMSRVGCLHRQAACAV